MAWFRDFETMKTTGTLPKNGNLMNLLNRRLNWEMTAEFGFSARIGRSLERQEAAVLFPDPLRLLFCPIQEGPLGRFHRSLAHLCPRRQSNGRKSGLEDSQWHADQEK